jgi:spore coat polysaccharide biosynthesis predicted glycosyltransferase SpsG
MALEALGARCVFALEDPGAAQLRRMGGEARAATPPPDVLACGLSRFSHVVLDDYEADLDLERRLGADGRRLLLLDDLAARPTLANLVLNPGVLGQDPYGSRAGASTVRLLGPAYALLRPGFAALRAGALARPPADELGRLCLSFGFSDVDGVALRAYRGVRAFSASIAIDLILGGGAQSLMELRAAARQDPRLSLHVDAADVAPILAAADAVLGAGGVGVWERACLGRPAVAVSVAANQWPLIAALAERGAHLSLGGLGEGFETALGEALERLRSPALRAALGRTSSALCDGQGARRAAEALLEVSAP